MSEKADRTYGIIAIDGAFTKETFTRCKEAGLIQTSIETSRRSNDGRFAIVKWRGAVPSDLTKRLVWTGTHQEALRKMETPEWSGRMEAPVEEKVASRMAVNFDSASDEPNASITSQPTSWQQIALTTAAATAILGAAAYALSAYFF